MKKLVLILGAMIALSSIGFASVTCTSVLGADVTTINGSGGCTVATAGGGSLLFNNFAVFLAGATERRSRSR